MERKKWNSLGMAAVAALWLGLSLLAWFSPGKDRSESERRPLAQMPEITAGSVLSTKFMTDFDSYALDQFPMRDGFRSLKARFHYTILHQQDNNGIYLTQGHAAKLEYPLNTASLDRALGVFEKIHSRYLSGSQVYFAVVPDKGYYLAEADGYPAMDYAALFSQVQAGTPYASYVNLADVLTAADYYRTDTHWRQEALLPAASRLCQAMGIPAPAASDYHAAAASRPFYGVYSGQAAVPLAPDALYTMESPLLESCRVYNHETGKYGSIYDEGKLSGDDLYEVFLSGSVSLLTIENPSGPKGKELIIFRDSFGSAIAPLLVQGYETVTLVDIRYLASGLLERFVDFHGQDVLFLYSTLVLNNSTQLQ